MMWKLRVTQVMPSGWEYKKLSELGFLGRGKSKHRPRNDPTLYGGEYPFVQTGDVKAAEFYLTSYSQTYNEKGLAQSKLWQPNTLLVTIAANIAETAILGIKACFPDSIVGFIANPDVADVRFVKYMLDIMKLNMQNISGGTTQDNLSLEKIQLFDFLIPPLPIQRRIASILSAYDDLIENNTRRIQALEQAAHDLYREWFVYFRFPGHESVRMIESGTRYGVIPQEWEVVGLRDLTLNIISGGTPSTSKAEYWNGGIPWLSSGETRSPLIISTEKTITELGVQESSTRLAKKLSTVIASAGQGKTRGQVSLLMIDTYINQSVLAVTCNPDVSTYLYIFWGLSSRYDELRGKSDAASSRGSLTKQIISELSFLKPPKRYLDKFDAVVMPMYEQMYNLMQKNQILREVRDLLLPRLVSGAIDVSNITFDFEESQEKVEE